MKKYIQLLIFSVALLATQMIQGQQPTVAAGFSISELASGGLLAGQTLSGIVVDPVLGDVYVAAQSISNIGSSSNFNLYKITPAGVISLLGNYPFFTQWLRQMRWGPDGLIYTLNGNTVMTIDPVTTNSAIFSTGSPVSSGSFHDLDFDANGDLIVSPEPITSFYRITPPSGSVFLGNSAGLINNNHGDAFGIQPDGNYAVYTDCGGRNNYSMDTSNHVDGTPFTVAWVSPTDIFDPSLPLMNGSCAYSNGAIDPGNGDMYSTIVRKNGANGGFSQNRILFTKADGGVTTLFVDNASGITDLTFGLDTSGDGCHSLFFLDTALNAVFEVPMNNCCAPKPDKVDTLGAGTFCASTTVTASGGAGGTVYYQGTDGSGTSTANLSSSEVVTNSGTYYFRSYNSTSGCWSDLKGAEVIINPLPTTPVISPSGNVEICTSTPTTLSIPAPVFSSPITYDIVLSDLINLNDNCGAGGYYGNGNSGFTWTDTGLGIPTNVELIFSVGVECNAGTHTSTLNGNAGPDFVTTQSCTCSARASSELITLNLGTQDYEVGGINTFLFNATTTGLVQDGSLGGNYARVLVTYGSDAVLWSPGGETTHSITVSPEVTTVYTATVTDNNGCSSSASTTITVDETPPTITCPDAITVDNDPGECGAVVTFDEPTATDNCGLNTSTGVHVLNPGELFFDYADNLAYSQGSPGLPLTFNPTDGNYMGVFLQNGPSTHMMYQDVMMPSAGPIMLDFDLQYESHTTLNVSSQFVAIEIRNVTTNAVLETLFKTMPGDPLSTPMTHYNFDLSAYANQNIRLCFINATINSFYFDVLYDAITIPGSSLVNGSFETGDYTGWNLSQSNSNGSFSTFGIGSGPPTTVNQTTGLASGSTFPVGTTTNTFEVTDLSGNTATCSFDVTVSDNEAPVLADCPINISQGNDAGVCTAVVTWTEPTASDNCTASGDLVWTKSHEPGDTFPVGITTVTYTATDAAGKESLACSFEVEVTNILPENLDGVISSTPDPIQAGTGFNLSADFNDDNLTSATWYFSSDGDFTNGDVAEHTFAGTIAGGVVSGAFNFDASNTGVYSVKVVVEDACGETAETGYSSYIVVYDPSGGFVTGGGWIYSPEGALVGSPVEGKANFGFVSKYKTGKNNVLELDGNTNFQFKEGDFHFKSSLYHAMSLIISGERKATYKGTGTKNGVEGYDFMVSIIDGDAPGAGPMDYDSFRIKVWHSGSPNDVVYDNEYTKVDNADASTALGGGSIVIHKPKGKGQEDVSKGTSPIMQDLMPEILETLALSPNPAISNSTVRFSVKEDALVTLKLYDQSGRLIESLFEGNVKAFENYDVNFQRRNLMSGVYIVKLTTETGHSYDKRIIIN